MRAELLTPSRYQSVIIKDISQTGVKLRLSKKVEMSNAVLVWHGHRATGHLIWLDGDLAGMRFHRDLEPSLLSEMTLDADSAPK